MSNIFQLVLGANLALQFRDSRKKGLAEFEFLQSIGFSAPLSSPKLPRDAVQQPLQMETFCGFRVLLTVARAAIRAAAARIEL